MIKKTKMFEILKRFRKGLSIVTLTMFVFTMTGMNNLFANVAVAPTLKVKNGVNDILIASEQGRILETFKGSSNETIICIQDLHAHKEVQNNIAEILSVLEESYGKENALDKVFVEGSWLKLNMDFIKAVPNLYSVKDSIINEMMDGGYMAGSEKYSANNAYSQVYGIENENLYKYNTKLLLESYKDRSEALGVIKLLKERKDALKKRRFTKEQIKFSDVVDSYDNGNISVIEYVKILDRYSKRLGINFSVEAPNLAKMLLLLDYRIQLGNIESIHAQARYFASQLAPQLGKEEVKKLNELKTENNTRYYLYLKKIVEQNNISLKNYRLLDLYFRYLDVLASINTNILVEEERKLKAKIYGFLIMTEEQQELVEIEEILNRYESFVNNSVSSIEATEFLGNENIYFEKLSSFVRRNQPYLIWAFQVKKGLPTMKKATEIMKVFYDYADKRNYELIENTLKHQNNISVMVLGGFHTEGVTQILRSKDVSYILITPNITEDHDNSIYEKRILEQAGMVENVNIGNIGKDKLALVSMFQEGTDKKETYKAITGQDFAGGNIGEALQALVIQNLNEAKLTQEQIDAFFEEMGKILPGKDLSDIKKQVRASEGGDVMMVEAHGSPADSDMEDPDTSSDEAIAMALQQEFNLEASQFKGVKDLGVVIEALRKRLQSSVTANATSRPTTPHDRIFFTGNHFYYVDGKGNVQRELFNGNCALGAISGYLSEHHPKLARSLGDDFREDFEKWYGYRYSSSRVIRRGNTWITSDDMVEFLNNILTTAGHPAVLQDNIVVDLSRQNDDFSIAIRKSLETYASEQGQGSVALRGPETVAGLRGSVEGAKVLASSSLGALDLAGFTSAIVKAGISSEVAQAEGRIAQALQKAETRDWTPAELAELTSRGVDVSGLAKRDIPAGRIFRVLESKEYTGTYRTDDQWNDTIRFGEILANLPTDMQDYILKELAFHEALESTGMSHDDVVKVLKQELLLKLLDRLANGENIENVVAALILEDSQEGKEKALVGELAMSTGLIPMLNGLFGETIGFRLVDKLKALEAKSEEEKKLAMVKDVKDVFEDMIGKNGVVAQVQTSASAAFFGATVVERAVSLVRGTGEIAKKAVVRVGDQIQGMALGIAGELVGIYHQIFNEVLKNIETNKGLGELLRANSGLNRSIKQGIAERSGLDEAQKGRLNEALESVGKQESTANLAVLDSSDASLQGQISIGLTKTGETWQVTERDLKIIEMMPEDMRKQYFEYLQLHEIIEKNVVALGKNAQEAHDITMAILGEVANRWQAIYLSFNAILTARNAGITSLPVYSDLLETLLNAGMDPASVSDLGLHAGIRLDAVDAYIKSDGMEIVVDLKAGSVEAQLTQLNTKEAIWWSNKRVIVRGDVEAGQVALLRNVLGKGLVQWVPGLATLANARAQFGELVDSRQLVPTAVLNMSGMIVMPPNTAITQELFDRIKGELPNLSSSPANQISAWINRKWREDGQMLLATLPEGFDASVLATVAVKQYVILGAQQRIVDFSQEAEKIVAVAQDVLVSEAVKDAETEEITDVSLSQVGADEAKTEVLKTQPPIIISLDDLKATERMLMKAGHAVEKVRDVVGAVIPWAKKTAKEKKQSLTKTLESEEARALASAA